MALTQVIRGRANRIINTSELMSRYTDDQFKAAASAFEPPRNCVDCDGASNIILTISWMTFSLLCIITGWICSLYYQSEDGDSPETIPQIVFAILRRLVTDPVRFVLTILAITAEILLEGSNAWSVQLGKFHAFLKGPVSACRPAATKVWWKYDAINHSHLANLSRQHLRATYMRALTIFRWTLAIGGVLAIVRSPLAESDTALASHDIQPYVVPAWVIKARPENRPYTGSSSHYRAALDCTCKPDMPNQPRSLIELQ